MAGILGLVATRDLPRAREAANRIADRMRLCEWQESAVREARPGRLYLGHVRNSQPPHPAHAHFHADGDLTCVLSGWIWHSDESCGIDADIDAERYAAAAVGAYRALGPDFATRLHGHFAVLLADDDAGTLIAANDRQGLEPLYVLERDDWTLFCSYLGPMTAGGLFEPELDPASVAEFLTYGQLFRDHTLIKGVRPMDPATILSIPLDGRERSLRRYWHFGHIGEKRRGLSLTQHVDEVCDTLIEANRRIMRREGTYLCGLSGGMDSRLVAAMAVRTGKPREAWTFGSPDSTDITIAGEVCRALGLGHRTFDPDPETLPEYADEFVDAVDGSCSLSYAYGRGRRLDLRGRANVVLNGLAGEVSAGGYMVGPKYKDVVKWLKSRTGRGPYFPSPWLEHNDDDGALAIFMASFYGGKSGLAGIVATPAADLVESIRTDFAGPLADVPSVYRVEQWLMQNRVRRWTMLGSRSDRPYFDDASHFYDYDFTDRCFRTPNRHRRGRRLYIEVFKRLMPEVAGIIYGNTGMPADTPAARVVRHKIVTQIRNRMAGRPAFDPAGSTGIRVTESICPAQKEYYRHLILDGPALARPLWDGKEARRMVEDHLAGTTDFGLELGLLGTVELFARHWIDRRPG